MQVPRHREIPIPGRGIRAQDQSGLHPGRRQGVPERPDTPAGGPGKEEQIQGCLLQRHIGGAGSGQEPVVHGRR